MDVTIMVFIWMVSGALIYSLCPYEFNKRYAFIALILGPFMLLAVALAVLIDRIRKNEP